MEPNTVKVAKFSIYIRQECYEELEKKAMTLDTSVSGMLSYFAKDLSAEMFQEQPMVGIANAWFESSLKAQEEFTPDEPSFVQWLFYSGRKDLFFCLLDSLYFHVAQFSQGQEISRADSRDEQCLQHINNLLLDRFCSSWNPDAGKGTVKLQDFPIDVRVHMGCIFDSIRHLYDDYVDREEINEDEELFGQDLLLAFDFWQERKLQY